MDSKFICKDRLVAGGHKMARPLSTTYYSVVTRESVRLEFIYSFLNDLYICSSDIVNVYLNATCQ